MRSRKGCFPAEQAVPAQVSGDTATGKFGKPRNDADQGRYAGAELAGNPPEPVAARRPDAAAFLALGESVLARRRNLAEASRDRYRRDLAAYVALAEARGLPVLSAPVETVAASALAFIAAPVQRSPDSPASAPGPSTENRKRAALALVYRAAVASGILDADPLADIASARMSRRRSSARRLDLDDTAALLEAAAAVRAPARHRTRAVVAVLATTGMRTIEAVRAEVQHWHPADRARLDVLLKGGTPHAMFLPPDAAEPLSAYLARRAAVTGARPKVHEPLFATRSGGRMAERDVRRTVARIAVAAGLGHLAPHALRASFLTNGHRAGFDVQDLADAVGHASARTTALYLLNDGPAVAAELYRRRQAAAAHGSGL
ncbi:MAG: site-specific integrase, partial [Catenulispora sp.]|nr:site-specific integrase [Catenulispora sp.]